MFTSVELEKNRTDNFLKTETEYWQRLNLACDPFINDANETYFSNSAEQACDLLHYLSNTQNALLSLVGRKGVGKTLLLRQFIAQLDEGVILKQFTATPSLDIWRFNSQLVQLFKLPQPIGGSWEEQYATHMMNLQYTGQKYFLIIDNAHLLPDETTLALLFLLKEQGEGRTCLSIIVSGELSLKEKLERLVTVTHDQHLIYPIPLEPFTWEETKTYLKTKLIATGLTQPFPFTDENIHHIHKQSNGLPQEINLFARQFLMTNQEDKPPMKLFLTGRARFLGLIGGVFLIILLALYLVKDYRNLHAAFQTTERSSSNTEEIAMLDTPLEETASVIPSSTEADLSDQTTVPVVATQASEHSALNEAAVVPLSKLMEEKESGTSKTTLNVAPPQEMIRPTPMVKADVYLSTQAEDQPKLQIASPALSINHSTAQISLGANNKRTASSHYTVKSLTAMTSKNKSQFLNHTGYCIQLANVDSEKAAKAFIKKYILLHSATYFKTERQNKTRYIVIYGPYHSYKVAKSSVNHLPMSLKQHSPWVRSSKDIKREIAQTELKNRAQLI